MRPERGRSVPAAIQEALARWGLLLLADQQLPSVASIIAGGPVRGSWWGHPAGAAIYEACRALAARRDVLGLKLVSRKLTYVHPRLLSAVLGVATARDAWQLEGLSAEARSLLDLVDTATRVRLDEAPWPGKRTRDLARELEERLLVYVDDVHTPSGYHVKRLSSWAAWREPTGFAGPPLDAAAARAALESAATALNEAFATAVLLPWQAAVRGPSREAGASTRSG